MFTRVPSPSFATRARISQPRSPCRSPWPALSCRQVHEGQAREPCNRVRRAAASHIVTCTRSNPTHAARQRDLRGPSPADNGRVHHSPPPCRRGLRPLRRPTEPGPVARGRNLERVEETPGQRRAHWWNWSGAFPMMPRVGNIFSRCAGRQAFVALDASGKMLGRFRADFGFAQAVGRKCRCSREPCFKTLIFP